MEKDLKKSLESTYRKHRNSFFIRAKRATRNILDAEDVVHEAFVKALSNLNVIEKVENISAWIFAVIRNRIIDLWRRSRTRKKAGEVDMGEETIAEIVAATGLDPCDELVRSELADALFEAIAVLPVDQREVTEAQVIDEMTFQELAERSGQSINTLMTRKKLAIRKLSSTLRGWITE